ncbi:hypothetical protein CR513_26983, partial [Mucuna pruriens]
MTFINTLIYHDNEDDVLKSLEWLTKDVMQWAVVEEWKRLDEVRKGNKSNTNNNNSRNKNNSNTKSNTSNTKSNTSKNILKAIAATTNQK